jgi:hypothetical protein
MALQRVVDAIYIFNSILLLLDLCELLDTTALLELGTQAFRYTPITSAKYVYVTNNELI